MDYLGNLNHDISVVGCWMSESNYKIALVLNREPLDIICAPSVGEEKAAEFETLFPAVKYICFDARLKKDYLLYTNLTTYSYPRFLVNKCCWVLDI